MQNARDFIHSNLNKATAFIHAGPRAGKCYKFLFFLFCFFFWQIKIASSFPAINLRFVINVLNNKTIILLNLAEYRLILANSAYDLVG